MDTKRAETIQYLHSLEEDQLIEVMGEVLERRRENDEFSQRCFYLGLAYSEIIEEWDEITGEPKGKLWSAWKKCLVAYLDKEIYGEDDGVHWNPLCQSGHCGTCGSTLLGCVKNAICPICGTKNYLT